MDAATGDRPESADLLLYDGLCGFCDGFVRFVLERDRRRLLQFAPLQSPAAARRLAAVGADVSLLPDSLVLLSGRSLQVKSAAGLGVLVRLGGWWRLLARVLGLVPAGWRDRLYDLLARHRYRLFGRRGACVLPDRAARARFLWD